MRKELTPMERAAFEAFDAGRDLHGELIPLGMTHDEFVRQWLHDVIASRNVVITRLQMKLAEADELIAAHHRSIDPRPATEWPVDSAVYRALERHKKRQSDDPVSDLFDLVFADEAVTIAKLEDRMGATQAEALDELIELTGYSGPRSSVRSEQLALFRAHHYSLPTPDEMDPLRKIPRGYVEEPGYPLPVPRQRINSVRRPR